MPNNLTDNEIKKALEEYVNFADFQHTEYTTIRIDVLKNTLDLINRQEEEIKTLQDEYRWLDQESDILVADVDNLNRICDEVNAENESLKAEVERLKREINLVVENSLSARLPHCVLCGDRCAILTEDLAGYDKLIAEIKAEAYKEFAERLLKKELKSKYFSHIAYQALKFDTNNLLNELVGDE